MSSIKCKFLREYPSGSWVNLPDYFGQDGKKKPYDAFCIYKGKFTAMEGKLHTSLSPFLFSEVAPHQIDSLRKVVKNNFTAYVIVGVRARLTAHDRHVLNNSMFQIKMDVYIPVHLIPGHGSNFLIKSINIRDIAKDHKLCGNKVATIELNAHQLEKYSGV